MKKYINRIADQKLLMHLESKGAVLIEGPKWCGKTTTANQIAKSVIEMDRPELANQYQQMAKLNPSLEIEGFLLTMYDSRLRLANQIYDEVKRHFRELVFRTVIQRNVKLSEAPSHGLPVLHYDVDSAGARNHLALAQEIIEKNEKQN
jgi:cellulose biosynthesis protein BcsQ